MVYQTDFLNLKIGDVLLHQFESDDNQEIIQALENYMKHNDYLRLKNELQEIGELRCNGSGEDEYQSEESNAQDFPNLLYALAWFASNQHLSPADSKKLKELNEQKHRQLQCIWEAYKVIKDSDDLLDSLIVFLRVRRQNEAAEAQTKVNMGGAGYEVNSAQSLSNNSDPVQVQAQPVQRPQQQQPPAPPASGGGFGLIKLNAMPTGNTPDLIPAVYQQEERDEFETQNEGEIDQSLDEGLEPESNDEDADRAE